jgi:hypothetical protein
MLRPAKNSVYFNTVTYLIFYYASKDVESDYFCVGPALLSLCPGHTCRGNVTDETGKALAGVNILVKGASNGTVSDGAGNYSIDIPEGEVVMLFMLKGYKRLEQKLETQSGRQYLLDVKLVKDLPGNRAQKSYGEMEERKPQ